MINLNLSIENGFKERQEDVRVFYDVCGRGEKWFLEILEILIPW